MYGSLNDASSLSNAFPDVTKQDTARDVRELRASFKSGLTLDIPQRKKVLLQIQKLLVEGEEVIKQALWKDLHKHKTEAYVYDFALTKVELQEHLDYLEDWAKPQKVGTDVGNLPGASYIHKDPLGVVCVIGTWNYPINLLFTPLISAVAAGNCVVARLPGDDTTRYLNNVLISLFDKYIDKRVVRYVYGGVEETKAMLRERYDLIFATGGCFLGKIVARAAAEHLTPTILELGGKSPAIVDNTADIDLAGRRIAWGAFLNSGQTCVRPDYILVDERVGDKLVESLKKYIHKFYGENPQNSESYGRVINERSFTRIQAVLDSDKASITHGGKTDAKENYVEPTLCNFKTNYEAFASSAVMSSELFGPIVPIYYYPAGRFQWAIEYINNHEKPLSSYLFTTNSKNKATITTQTSSGGLVFNDVIMHLGNSQLPFGGVGNSGHGSYHGKAGFDAFSHTKSVLHKYSFLDTAERYAPYSDRNEKVLRLALHAYSRKQIRTFKFLFYTASIAAIAFGVLKAVKKYNP